MGLVAFDQKRESQPKAFASGRTGSLWKSACTLIVAVLFVGSTIPALAYDPSIDRDALKLGLQTYTSCSSDCAQQLGLQILNESVDVGLKTVGAIKANGSTPLAVKYMTFYVLLRSAYESGKKIVNDNAACYNKCGDLNKEIVILGTSGLLGPMLKGEKVDPTYFSNTRIIDAYTKFLKPIQLPAEERGAAWAKYIASLS